MAKRTKFIFTEKLAQELVKLPENLKRSGFGYAMNYGLGRVPESDEPMFGTLTKEIDRANREKETHCTAEDVKEIVEYLNEALGTSFRADCDGTRKKINARFGEGYTAEDFRLVIDYKKTEWEGTDQSQFLRPETLFGSKFEGYLQAARKHPKKAEPSFDTNDFFQAALARSYAGMDESCGGEVE